MLGADTQAHESRGNSTKDWKFLQKSERQRKAPDRCFASQGRFDEAAVREDLKCLSHFGGEFPAFLDFVEMLINGAAILQRLPQNVGGGDCVLNGDIDANAANGRHGVSGIADAEKSRPRPVAQAIDGD